MFQRNVNCQAKISKKELETDHEKSESDSVSDIAKSFCLSTVSPAPEDEGFTLEGFKRPSRRKSLEVQEHKEEKARIRSEKEKKLQEAREAKKREKEREQERGDVERSMTKQKKKLDLGEKLKQKEVKKTRKEAENEEKLKAQEEKKTKKMELLQAEMDEKKHKEEEERERKKEEEKKQRKLEEKKKFENEISAKSSAVFESSLIKGSSAQQQTPTEKSNDLFKPFEVTKNMVLASITLQDIMRQFDKDNLDNSFHKQDTSCLYLEELKICVRTPYKRKKAVFK